MLAITAIRSSVLIVAIWIGLKALRVSNPHILMSTWRLVLFASLASPFLVGHPIYTIGADLVPALLVPTDDTSISSFATDLPLALRPHGGIEQHQLERTWCFHLLAGCWVASAAIGGWHRS
jgi:hypothetical protein